MAASYPTLKPTYDYPFAAIPHDLIGDERLGHTEVRAYAVLVWMAFEDSDQDGQYTHAAIADRMNCSERSVARPLAKLEETGWIERQPVHTGHGRMADRFVIHRERDSKRADSRTWIEANRADLRGRDRADLRGPTTPKEKKNTPAPSSEALRLPVQSPTRRQINEQTFEQEFQEFFLAYPKQWGEEDARREYRKARRIAEHETLVLHAAMFRRLLETKEGHDPQFTPMPANWLKKRRWKDPIEDELRAQEERQRRAAEQRFTGPEQRYV